MEKKAVVVGAGLVGSLWSIFLAQRGYQVDVYERRDDLRKSEIDGGRSINLAMSNRGWKAMEKAGIFEKIRSMAIPMYGRMMHSAHGELTYQPYGLKEEAIYSVSRARLNRELMDLADQYSNSRFFFNKKCTGLNLKKNKITFRDYITGEITTLDSTLLFGADGAFSKVRYSLQKTNRFNYSQHYLEHGYKELRIPPASDGSHLIDKNALHIWPRENFMLIALPNADGSFTCTLFLPFEGPESFENLQTDEQIVQFFEKHFADAVPIMPELIKDFHDNPASSLVTVRCNPWQYDRRVLLLGDAAHAIVPFYGQGMNCGFEDCTVLNEMMDKHHENWPDILEEFNESRPADANAIADLALRNFIEMRDLVGDPKFLLRKKIEKYFNEKYGDDFLPLYSQVTFSHIPYSKALEEGKSQDRLFDRIMAIENIEEKWNGEEVEAIFRNWLKKKELKSI